MDYKTKADEIIKGSKELAEKIKHANISMIPDIIASVELQGIKENFAGTDKKKLVIEILNRFINIPVLPEWAEEKVISFAIDMVISVLNKFLGKKWMEKINPA